MSGRTRTVRRVMLRDPTRRQLGEHAQERGVTLSAAIVPLALVRHAKLSSYSSDPGRPLSGWQRYSESIGSTVPAREADALSSRLSIF